MKYLFISALVSQTLFGQTLFNGPNSRIPGLSDGFEMSANWTSNDIYDTVMLSISAGAKNTKYGPSYFELEGGAGFGGTGLADADIDPFYNFELSGGGILKYELILDQHKIIPFARAGLTFNYLTNKQEYITGYSDPYISGNYIYWTEYYEETGESFFDTYGKVSVGLSYVSPQENFALSAEIGNWSNLAGDLGYFTDSVSPTFWSAQIFYNLNESTGIKLSYSSMTIGEFDTETFGGSITIKF
jgi:hypothetical protein